MRLLSRLVLVITLTATSVAAQTKVTPPKNKYTPEQDVQIGREAAAEVRKEYPIINDDNVEGYLERLGDRLVEAAPRELNNPAFQYSFTPVNLKDINAFALPGGPMFVNRGMIEAATTEGQVAGVMAHELAHVLLRHGTANATKQQGFQIGALAGAIAGAVIGGNLGQIVSQGLAVRPRHVADEIQPRVREAGGPRRRADHGARRLRSARSRGDVRNHREAGRRQSAAVAELASQSWQPHAVHQRGGRAAAHRPAPEHSRVSAGSFAPVVHAPGAHHGGARTQRRRGWRRWPHHRRLGRSHRRSRAAAIAPVSNRAGRPAVHGERAVQLASGVVGDRREVRAAECVWRVSRGRAR